MKHAPPPTGMPLGESGESANAFSSSAAVRERAAQEALDGLLRVRKQVSVLMEVLLALLDAIDVDENLEDGADTEPNLAGYEYVMSDMDDAEADDDREPIDYRRRSMRACGKSVAA